MELYNLKDNTEIWWLASSKNISNTHLQSQNTYYIL